MKHLWTNGQDTFIAETADDAMKEWEDYTGDVDMSQSWEMIPDDKQVDVYFEDEINPEHFPENHVRRENNDPEDQSFEFEHPWKYSITAKAIDWANGNWDDDFLCSTEW